jgi:hypothetical protein
MADTQAGPTGMTFTSLVDDLRRYAERGGQLDEAVEVQIPRIINNSERDLADRLKIQGYLAPYTSRMKIGQPRVAKPSNWRSTVSINFGTGVDQRRRKTLRARSYEYVRAIYPDDSQLGEPALYADYNEGHWLFKPSPNDKYPFEAMVWRLPDLLSPSNETNYLTELAPNLLLYTSMMGLAAYLKDMAAVSIWKGMADERFGNIDSQDKKRIVDRAQVRSTS